ncbi:unnamed protein product [Meloidogyne enterolobii]|uniref:Uncharacterized protein n=1 Tax=Meloidogyne enterolobii TaxID=390850 RepID=A0ACB0YT64_MELEN
MVVVVVGCMPFLSFHRASRAAFFFSTLFLLLLVGNALFPHRFFNFFPFYTSHKLISKKLK